MELDHNVQTFEFLKGKYPGRNIVKALLDLNEITRTDIARDSGININTVYTTVNQHRKNPKVQGAISRKLGIPARELFDGKNELKPLSPISMAIDTINQTIRDLQLKRSELVALLPKQPRKKHTDTFITNPLSGKKRDYKKCGRRYTNKRRHLSA